MTPSTTLIERLRDIARKLEKAAVWRESFLPVDMLKDDYVFELLCYFHTALAAQGKFRLQLTGRIDCLPSGKLVARWPKKPGHKKNFSYIQLLYLIDQEIQFQLCPGIRIRDRHGKSRAPDVNLLSGAASDEPTHADLLACWDAKYTSIDGDRLSDVAVSDFVYTFQQLGKPIPPPEWNRVLQRKEYERCGIFTNGDSSTEPDAALREQQVYETYWFPEAPVTRP